MKPLKIKPTITLEVKDAEARDRVRSSMIANGLPDNDLVLDSYIYRMGLGYCDTLKPLIERTEQ